MALFKIFYGDESLLNSISYHEGYAYFCADTGNMFIDVGSTAGSRLQVNAYAATELIKREGETITEVSVDDLLLKDAQIAVAQGGTGASTLTLNALLVGNGTDAVKMVKIPDGALVVGDGTDGVKGITVDAGGILSGDATSGIVSLKGTGVLAALTEGSPSFMTATVAIGGTGKTSFTSGAVLTGNGDNAIAEVTGTGVLMATTSGSPSFDIASVAVGGTGGATAAAARENLEVYSKSDVDSKVTDATSVNYTTTLYASGWTASGSNYVYNYSNTNLVAKNPPIVTYTSNLDEYSTIDSAEATANTGIVFTASEKPDEDIGIIIIDVL